MAPTPGETDESRGRARSTPPLAVTLAIVGVAAVVGSLAVVVTSPGDRPTLGAALGPTTTTVTTVADDAGADSGADGAGGGADDGPAGEQGLHGPSGVAATAVEPTVIQRRTATSTSTATGNAEDEPDASTREVVMVTRNGNVIVYDVGEEAPSRRLASIDSDDAVVTGLQTSPDGSLVLLEISRPTPDCDAGAEIALLDATAGKLTTIGSGVAARFSPDGAIVSWVRGGCPEAPDSVVLHEVETGMERSWPLRATITEPDGFVGTLMAWHPNGTAITYGWAPRPEDPPALRSIDVATGRSTSLGVTLEGSTPEVTVQWRQLVYQGERLAGLAWRVSTSSGESRSRLTVLESTESHLLDTEGLMGSIDFDGSGATLTYVWEGKARLETPDESQTLRDGISWVALLWS